MKKSILGILLLFQLSVLFCQSKELCFDHLIPMNPHSNESIAAEVYIFNELMKITSFDDSIKYQFEGKTIHYYFKGHQIRDWTYPNDNVLMKEYVLLQNRNKLLINYPDSNEYTNLNNELRSFIAYIPINENSWKVLNYSSQLGRTTINCSILNEFNKDGEEKMYRCDGSLIYERHYQLIDSSYVSVSSSLLSNPKMYIEQKIFHDKSSQKCGVWRYYNQDGSIREEEYEKCN